jgi:hypothetical protein
MSYFNILEMCENCRYSGYQDRLDSDGLSTRKTMVCKRFPANKVETELLGYLGNTFPIFKETGGHPKIHPADVCGEFQGK